MGTCKEKPSCSPKTNTVHLKAKQLKEHQPVFLTKKYKTKENKIPHQKTTTKTKHVEKKTTTEEQYLRETSYNLQVCQKNS